MMCRVVHDKYLPLYKSAPIQPLIIANATSAPDRSHNTNDIYPNILPTPSLTTDRKDFLSTVRDRSIQTTLSTIFGLDLAWENEDKVSLETKEVKQYIINNPGAVFKELMKDDLYARDVRALLKDASFGRAYLVVGFLTASGALWTREGVQRTKVSANFTAPITETLGVPPMPGLNVDPGLGFGIGNTKTTGRTHISPDEEIFAVAYALVKIKYGVDRNGVTRTVKVGPPKRGSAKHLVLHSHHGDDSEDDSEVDDHNDDEGVGTNRAAEAPNDITIEEVALPLDGSDVKWSFELDGK
jgi:hypothetical protein